MADRVGQGDLPRLPMQLDQVRPLDGAQVRPGTALLHPQQRLERVEGIRVDVKSRCVPVAASRRRR